jgi:hypothetical protein
VHVRLDRAQAQEELLRYLLVAHPAGEEVEDLQLTVGQGL